MTQLPHLRLVLTFSALLCLGGQICQKAIGENRLTIGSNAPTLAISDWMQKGTDAAATPVTTFEKGKVYIVEFWATWCGPCIQSMPHLAMLQRKFADKGVRIVSVSEEDIPTVDAFLARETKTQDGGLITFKELTKDYSLTTDPDGSTHRDYTSAANINGIPVAFIVGKDSKIEWIGHPRRMDEPLAQVVDGSWDRSAFAATYEEEKRFEELQESISMRLESTNGREPSPKLINAILAAVDTFVKGAKSPNTLRQAQYMQMELLLNFKPNDSSTLEAYKTVAGSFDNRPLELNGLNWGIYELANSGHLSNRDFLAHVIEQTNAILAKVPAKQTGTVYDTLAHLQYLLKDLPAALKSAKLAAAAPDATPDFATFVSKIEAEIAGK